jgi:hypothetical protein
MSPSGTFSDMTDVADDVPVEGEPHLIVTRADFAF